MRTPLLEVWLKKMLFMPANCRPSGESWVTELSSPTEVGSADGSVDRNLMTIAPVPCGVWNYPGVLVNLITDFAQAKIKLLYKKEDEVNVSRQRPARSRSEFINVS